MEVKRGTDDVVEERVGGLRRQRVDEVKQFTQQKDEFILLVTMSQLLEEHSEEQGRLLNQTVPDHLLSHRTHFTHIAHQAAITGSSRTRRLGGREGLEVDTFKGSVQVIVHL